MNKKGFTMVELLVAMAIMGLLIIMAFPTIRAIRANNTETKYEEYGKSAISAAKLYTDSYAEDIFDPDKNSQYKSIPFNDLVKKDLLKDINISGSSCLNDSSIRIVKYNNDYDYCLNLHCKSGSKEVYSETDRKGSCKNFDSKIKHVIYRYKNYTPFTVEVLKGDSNYQLLDPTNMSQFLFGNNKETFKGWSLDSNPTTSSIKYQKGTIYPKTINNDITFYAYTEKWKYKINYIKNSDGTYSGTMNSTDCTYGDNCTLRDLGYSRTGYHFRNWQKDSNTTFGNKANVKTSIGNSIKYDGEQINLTGIFDINVCTVTYSPNNGTFNNNASNTVQKQNYGTYYGDVTYGMRNAKGGTYDATKTGYHIDSATAWKAGNKTFDETKRYLAQDVCDLSSGNNTATLNVNWKNDIYTITLKNQGANSGSPGTSKIYLQYNNKWCSNSSCTNTLNNETITIPKKTNANAYLPDYFFIGYYTNTNCKGTKIINSSGKIVGSKTVFTSNKTLYACWKEKGWSLTNSKTPLTGQKWEYWYSPSKQAENGIHLLCANNNNCPKPAPFLFKNGIAQTGWYKDDKGYVYYFLDTDYDGNGWLDLRAAHSASKEFSKGWAHFDDDFHCVKGIYNNYNYQYCGGY